ncbi:class I SAM-dependent methyltransferase [soil metagenome]
MAAAARSQVLLRQRAIAKFGPDAAAMFFTPAGLEQATRPAVAALRAQRYAAAGADRVLDLGCGIGSDALALARAGLHVHAVEQDPVTAAVCRLNAAVLGLAYRIGVWVADATTMRLAGWPAAFCDPGRRRDGRRVFDPSAYSPPWSFLLTVAEAVPLTGLKVAPGIQHALVPDGAEAQWVSDGGDVTEAALWFGRLSTGVPRRATLLPGGATLTDSGGGPPPVGPVGAWLYEPDGAVIRAGLVGEVVGLTCGRLLDSAIAYLTSDTLVPTPYATAYSVVEVLPFGLKRLRAALRQRNVGVVTIKKRGTAVEPEQLRRAVRLSGTEHLVVVLTRIAGAQSVLLCHPSQR